ncbi:MAG TPA: DUF6057 family protein [Draconibacterium sp.]|nr:DUF6057 family protein [Draconibacterium sp.]
MKSEKSFWYFVMVLFSVFTFLFCFFAVDTSLHHHYQQIAWQSGNLFLNYYCAFPGGIAEYLTLFISQFFASNLIGSVLLALSGFLVSFFLFKTIYSKIQRFSILFFVVPILQIILLAVMFDYHYHFSITVNLLLVSVLLFVNTEIDRRTGSKISFHTYISGIVIYYISGGIFFLIFMFSAFVLSLGKPEIKRILNTLLIIAFAFLIPFTAYHFITLGSLNSSFFRATPDVAAMLRYSRPIIFYIELAAIPFIIFLIVISSFFRKKVKKTKKLVKDRAKSETAEIPLKNDYRKYKAAGVLFVLATGSLVILKFTFSPAEKLKIEIDYYANQQNWEKVILLSSKIEKYDRMVNFQFNRALLNTGQVLEKLFDYEQLLGSKGLFIDRPFASEVALPNSDLYFDLGNIDESQRFAFESETLMKNSPRVLKRLILNCIIMEKMDAAETYLNILSKNPTEKKWVEKYRAFIQNPNLAMSDSLIVRKRKDMNKTEGIFGSPPLKLISQLERNPKNKGAFEYLIALDLLDHDLTSFEEDLKYLGGLQYKKLPVAIEEAVILFRSQAKSKGFLNIIRISETTTQRFREFAKLTSASKGDREKAKQATTDFKNTYWYYVLFLSPKVTNLKLETKPVDTNY